MGGDSNYFLVIESRITMKPFWAIKIKRDVTLLPITNSLSPKLVCFRRYTGYVMDPWDCVQSIILLPCIGGTSFMLVTLIRLKVSEPGHWVTWSLIRFPHFWGEKESNTLVFLLNHINFNSLFVYLKSCF